MTQEYLGLATYINWTITAFLDKMSKSWKNGTAWFTSSHLAVKMHCPNSWWWWWLLITDSAQAENCPTFHFPCVHPWTGLTSHISPIYEGIISKWILTEPIKLWPPWSLWPFWLIKCLIKKIIVECASITLSCLNARICDMEEDESWFLC